MRKLLYLIILSAFLLPLFSGCNTGEVEKLQQEVSSLSDELDEANSKITNLENGLEGATEIPPKSAGILDGKWSGQMQMFHLGNKEKFNAEVEFTVGSKLITGHCVLTLDGLADQLETAGYPGLSSYDLTLTGAIYGGSMIYLNYRNVDKDLAQMGIMMLRFSGGNQYLQGDYMGYDPISLRVVKGGIKFQRLNSEQDDQGDNGLKRQVN